MFIEAENIRKSYGRKTTVLNGASFHAASGEYIAIVGANGCGKSTLDRKSTRLNSSHAR